MANAGAVADRTKALHDLVLSLKPAEVADHKCTICDTTAQEDTVAGITEDELAAKVAAAVDAAVAERDARIAELTDKVAAQTAEDATLQAVADATKPLEDKIVELQTTLDAEILARGAAETERKALVDWLEAEADVATEKERREGRIAAVKDVGIWPEDTFDESVVTNKDRIDNWVALEDEVFEQLIDGWKLNAPAKKDPANGPIPTGRSALTDALTEGAGGQKSNLKRMLETTMGLASAQAND